MNEAVISRLEERLSLLESESDIRRLVARYFEICDDLGPSTPIDELGMLFTADAQWEGRGRYAKAFGSYDGRRAITDMIASYCLPEAHFDMTGHFFSAEAIRVVGDTASGNWMMLQCTTYADGRSDLRSAKLELQFVREDDTWRISRFQTTNIFTRRVERWTDSETIPVPDMDSAGAEE